MNQKAFAYSLLFLAAILWGAGNIILKLVLQHVEPVSAVGLRCAIAAAALLPFVAGSWRQVRSPSGWKTVFPVVFYFSMSLVCQQFGYRTTSVTNASFLVNIGTVLVPVVCWLRFGYVPCKMTLVSCLISFLGVCLMSGTLSAHGLTPMGPGDLLCCLAGLFNALWTIALFRHAQSQFPAELTAFVQVFCAALVALPYGIAVEGLYWDAAIAALPASLLLGLFSTALAFSLVTFAQRHASPTAAVIVLSTESVFGALGGMMFLGETASIATIAGGALILFAIIPVALSSQPLPG